MFLSQIEPRLNYAPQNSWVPHEKWVHLLILKSKDTMPALTLCSWKQINYHIRKKFSSIWERWDASSKIILVEQVKYDEKKERTEVAYLAEIGKTRCQLLDYAPQKKYHTERFSFIFLNQVGRGWGDVRVSWLVSYLPSSPRTGITMTARWGHVCKVRLEVTVPVGWALVTNTQPTGPNVYCLNRWTVTFSLVEPLTLISQWSKFL